MTPIIAATECPTKITSSSVELVADGEHVLRVAIERRVPLGVVGAEVRASRTHVIEQHDPEPILEARDDMTPHLLVAPEPVREEQRLAVVPTELVHVAPVGDAHRSRGYPCPVRPDPGHSWQSTRGGAKLHGGWRTG